MTDTDDAPDVENEIEEESSETGFKIVENGQERTVTTAEFIDALRASLNEARAQLAQMQAVAERQEALLRELHAVAKTGSIRNGAWSHVKERLLAAFAK